MDGAAATAAARALVKTIETSTNAETRKALTLSLVRVAGQLKPAEVGPVCRSAAQVLAKALDDVSETQAPRALAEALAGVAPALPPSESAPLCRRGAARLARNLAATADAAQRRRLADGLAVLCERLPAAEGDRLRKQAATVLLQALSAGGDPVQQRALAAGLAQLVGGLDSAEAAPLCLRAAALLIQATGATTQEQAGPLLGGLWLVLSSTDAAQRGRRCQAVASGVGGLWPLLAPAVEPLGGPLTTQQLVDLLKQPLCLGAARRLVLGQLEIRYQRPFADHWDFVRFAEEKNLGLDFKSAAPRLTEAR